MSSSDPEFWICLYFGGVTLLAFGAMGIDKLQAIFGWRRISERNLLFMAMIGGGVGAKLGQIFFRHKTRKNPMRSRLQRRMLWSIFLFGVLILPVGRNAIGNLIHAVVALLEA